MRMSTDNGRFLLLSLIAAVIAGLVFTPGLPGEFVFDDIPNIVNNTVIHVTQLNGEALAKVATTSSPCSGMRTSKSPAAKRSLVWAALRMGVTTRRATIQAITPTNISSPSPEIQSTC